MRYGGDKIKLITDDLRLGDNVQVLGFDTCGFALIGKWKNEYGTKGDPLNASEAPCGSEGNCPNCQPKITDVGFLYDLNGRPERCSGGDAILALSSSGSLKTICRSNFTDNDKRVAVSSGDEEPGYLKDKLKICDRNSPITIEERTAGDSQYLCIGWDSEKAGGKLVEMMDGPGTYPTTQGVLVGDNEGWDWVEPSSGCDKARYQYLAYDMKTHKMVMTCDKLTSLASWTFQGGYMRINTDSWTQLKLTNNNTTTSPTETLRLVGGAHEYRSTEDVKIGTGEYLFEITTPGVYTITANCTMHNRSEAGIQAIRGGMIISEGGSNPYEVGDAKFDGRKYTQYITDQPMGSVGGEQNLELSIMSFNTVYIKAFPNASVEDPVKIGFVVSIDTHLHDAKMSQSQEDDLKADKIEIGFTDGTPAMGPKTVISCVRNGDVPSSYKQR